jgi:predicted NBD/HSP70 family sugar kinase
MTKLTLGADIGGTNTCIGSVNAAGDVLCRESFSTADYNDGALYADRLANAARDVMTATATLCADDLEWLGFGIGAPNGNFRSGSIESPPNLNFKGITPLVALLNERLDLPKVALTNDANAAAIGEKIYGGAKDYDDFIMITLGTGLGSGIFVNGQLVYGHDGFAGELGHISVIPDGRYCGFGRRGSLENYCSATDNATNALLRLGTTAFDEAEPGNFILGTAPAPSISTSLDLTLDSGLTVELDLHYDISGTSGTFTGNVSEPDGSFPLGGSFESITTE